MGERKRIARTRSRRDRCLQDFVAEVPLLVAALTASSLAVFRSAKRWHPSSKQEVCVDLL